MNDVIETVIETLPSCQVRKIAYATFTIISIDNQTMAFEVFNFDNPDPIFIRNNQRYDLECTETSALWEYGKILPRNGARR